MAKREIKKSVKNAVLYTDGTIRISNVRGSYIHVDKPYKGKTDDGGTEAEAKYSAVGILMKDTHVEAKDLIQEVIKEILIEKKAKVARDKRFIRDGDDAEKEEYEGAWTVSAREINKPKCRDRSGALVTEIADIRTMFQSGYWFNILIRPWFQDNKFGKRVNAGLVAIQFVKKDKTFGEGAIDDEGVWDQVEGDDDLDGPGDGLDDDEL